MNQLALESQPQPEYRTIPLTQGQVAIVDAEDFECLSRHKWYARWDPRMQSFYAQRNGKWINQKEGKRESCILMHREIMGLASGDPRQVDHRESGSTLDNRKSNLRVVSQEKNKINRRLYRNNTSGVKGVWYHRKNRKWLAGIQVGGKDKHLGSFKTKDAAHEAYCEAARQLHGEFANFGHVSNPT